MIKPTRVLAIDDDPGDLRVLEQFLSAQKIQYMTAKDWESALYLFTQNKFDLVIVELELEGLPGTALVQKWRNHDIESKRDAAIIISVGNARKGTEEALIQEIGDIAIVAKPFKQPALLGAIAKAMDLAANRGKVENLRKKILDPLIQQKKFEKAVTVAETKLTPLGDRGLKLAADVYCEAEQLQKGLDVYTELSQKYPTNMLYINEIGRIHMKLGNLQEAEEAFERSDMIAPFNLQRTQEMAYLYLDLDKPDKAIEKFKNILDLNPENKEMKFDIYDTLSARGYDEHAKKLCKDTSTPMELIRHYNNKGVLFSKQEQYVDAIDEYAKARKYAPKSKDLYRILYNMAIAHINLKNINHLREAQTLLEECLKLKPDFEKAKDKLETTFKHLNKTAS